MRFRWFIITLIVSVSSLLAGCMDSVIEKEIAKTEETKANTDNSLTEWRENPVTAKDASDNLAGETFPDVQDIEIKISSYQTAYTDLNEFSLFVSDLFFKFYTGQIHAESFVKLISPHLSNEFQEQIPSTLDGQVQMFSSLQSLIEANLTSPIARYIASTAEIQEKTNTAIFYRTFLLEDESKVYYETIAILEDGVWKLQEDSPTTNYKKEK